MALANRTDSSCSSAHGRPNVRLKIPVLSHIQAVFPQALGVVLTVGALLEGQPEPQDLEGGQREAVEGRRKGVFLLRVQYWLTWEKCWQIF